MGKRDGIILGGKAEQVSTSGLWLRLCQKGIPGQRWERRWRVRGSEARHFVTFLQCIITSNGKNTRQKKQSYQIIHLALFLWLSWVAYFRSSQPACEGALLYNGWVQILGCLQILNPFHWGGHLSFLLFIHWFKQLTCLSCCALAWEWLERTAWVKDSVLQTGGSFLSPTPLP